ETGSHDVRIPDAILVQPGRESAGLTTFACGGPHGRNGQTLVDRVLRPLFDVSQPRLENSATTRSARTDRRQRTRAAALAATGLAGASDGRSLAVGPCPAPTRGVARA